MENKHNVRRVKIISNIVGNGGGNLNWYNVGQEYKIGLYLPDEDAYVTESDYKRSCTATYILADHCEILEYSEEQKENSIKSDGGSSEYYQKTITRLEDGETFDCQTGDIIRCLVNNDFDGGNIVKAVDRIFQSIQGKGKEGTSIEYDCNKIIYFANIIKKRFEDK